MFSVECWVFSLERIAAERRYVTSLNVRQKTKPRRGETFGNVERGMLSVYSECDLKSRPEGNEYNTKKHTAPTELSTYRHYVAINMSPLRG